MDAVPGGGDDLDFSNRSLPDVDGVGRAVRDRLLGAELVLRPAGEQVLGGLVPEEPVRARREEPDEPEAEAPGGPLRRVARAVELELPAGAARPHAPPPSRRRPRSRS